MLDISFHNEKNKKNVISNGKFLFKNVQLAIIDLGTNSVRMDVYRLQGRSVSRIARKKIMIRLGDDVFKTGFLSEPGMQRTIQAFQMFNKIIKQKYVTDIVAFGTSALRSARNAKEFLHLLKLKTGIQVKIISGKEEGELIAEGIINNMNPPKGLFGLIDIGGGSTEVSICHQRQLLKCRSFKLGANRLQQMFFEQLPLVAKRGHLHPLLALRQYIKNELQPIESLNKKNSVKVLIGSSGTIRAVSKILKKFNRSGQPIARSDLSALISEMQDMSREEIKKIPGLEPKRVDLILPGSILLEELMFSFKLKHIVVTDLALRDGILQRALVRYRTVQGK